MRARRRIVCLGGRGGASGLLGGILVFFAAFATAALAGECRIAFDVGSSGVRVGSTASAASAQADIDYLGPQWAGDSIGALAEPTRAALRVLPRQAGFPKDCARVGGAFSAWRLASTSGDPQLLETLARLATETGVAVLLIPQRIEGSYALASARARIGTLPAGEFVLDIGGGSLQIAGTNAGFGAVLGQKAWQRLLCTTLRGAARCALPPLREDELARARALLAQVLADAGIGTLPVPLSMTAVSRPVTRGVAPALARLSGNPAEAGVVTRAALARAIARIAPLDSAVAAELAGISPRHAGYLLTDLLLVEGLLAATGGEFLHVVEADVSNVPGILADDRAYAWARNYGCYLRTLARRGVDAYFDDPARCLPGAR